MELRNWAPRGVRVPGAHFGSANENGRAWTIGWVVGRVGAIRYER